METLLEIGQSVVKKDFVLSLPCKKWIEGKVPTSI